MNALPGLHPGAFWLVSVRLGTVMMLMPLEGLRQLPRRVRLMLTLLLAALLTAFGELQTNVSKHPGLIIATVYECLNGLVLSLAVLFAFATLSMAGKWMDMQTGFDAGALFNPAQNSHDPLLTRLLGLFAASLFFSMDAHLSLIGGLAASFTHVPPGTLVLTHGLDALAAEFSLMAGMALMLAAPVVCGMLLLEGWSALLSRGMPHSGLWFLTLPLKILAGLTLLAASLDALAPVITHLFTHALSRWEVLFHG